MEDSVLEDLLKRLATLFVKLDSTYDQLLAFTNEQHNMNNELRDFNRQQIAINERLETLVKSMMRQQENGRDA